MHVYLATTIATALLVANKIHLVHKLTHSLHTCHSLYKVGVFYFFLLQ